MFKHRRPRCRKGKYQKGETVLVVGAGPIGLSVMNSQIEGCKVIAMDVRKSASHLAADGLKPMKSY
ncbi:hypothetical protein PO124_20430 [Bacillus licheniformis]|nr:hypothetical protein [Bacillus licheniformis]